MSEFDVPVVNSEVNNDLRLPDHIYDLAQSVFKQDFEKPLHYLVDFFKSSSPLTDKQFNGIVYLNLVQVQKFLSGNRTPWNNQDIFIPSYEHEGIRHWRLHQGEKYYENSEIFIRNDQWKMDTVLTGIAHRRFIFTIIDKQTDRNVKVRVDPNKESLGGFEVEVTA